MHVRVTHYRVKPGRVDEAVAGRDELMPEIERIPGLKRYMNLWNDDGTGLVVAVYESKAAAEASAETAKAMWSRLSDLLEPDFSVQEFANIFETAPQ